MRNAFKGREIDYNNLDDRSIIIIMEDKDISLEKKEYVINNYYEMVYSMDEELILKFFRSLDLGICKKCSKYIKIIIENIDEEIFRDLLLIDMDNPILSPIASYLVEQNWFEDVYYYNKGFILAYKLIKDYDQTDEVKIMEYGNDIIDLLLVSDSDIKLSNIIMRNYLEILQKNDSCYLYKFIEAGYKKIDEYINDDVMLTYNMIIFDCYITSSLLDIKSFSYLDFYISINDMTYAYYDLDSQSIMINIFEMKRWYRRFKNKKMGSQLLLCNLAHELIHASQFDYLNGKKECFGDFEKLRIFNLNISHCSSYSEEFDYYFDSYFNYKYHDSFFEEYDANIMGIKILYAKYKLLPSITEDDKKIMNMRLADILFDSYSDDVKSPSGKLSPVDFSWQQLKKTVGILYDYDQEELINKIPVYSKEFYEIEKKLTDYEKFLLGYDNPYLELLEMIANGKLSSTNLFNDLPIFYRKYGPWLEGKYISCTENDDYNQNKYKYLR